MRGADHAAALAEDDDHGKAAVVGRLAAQLQAQVDDGHDHAAQVDHTLDGLQRAGNSGGRFVAAQLLHASLCVGLSMSAASGRMGGGRRDLHRAQVRVA